MDNECMICSKNIDINIQNKYNFIQECNCFYNVHEQCLVDWLNHSNNKCMLCFKPVKYTVKHHRPFKEEAEPNSYKCCIIL